MDLKTIHQLGCFVDYFSDLKIENKNQIRALSRSDYESHRAKFRQFNKAVSLLIISEPTEDAFNKWHKIMWDCTGAFTDFLPQIKLKNITKEDLPAKRFFIQFIPNNYKAEFYK